MPELDEIRAEDIPEYELTNYFVTNPVTIILVSFIILVCLCIIAYGQEFFVMSDVQVRDYYILDDPRVI